MQFRTSLLPDTSLQGLVSHSSAVVLLGSCFADNVGARLREEGFDVTVNPAGTLYNPLSIRDFLTDTLLPREPRLVHSEGLFHSLGHHSRLSSPVRETLLERIAAARMTAREAMARASALFITLGTAYVYYHHSDGLPVANCHKLHPAEFIRRRLAVSECAEALTEIVEAARSLSPACRIIFTVSPVRHTADGLHANNVSKATLLLAVEELREREPEVLYFPAYEALMDDLRDYRFYASDMKHPSDTAIDYVYELFASSYCTPPTREEARRRRKEALRQAHRPNADTL